MFGAGELDSGHGEPTHVSKDSKHFVASFVADALVSWEDTQ